ncbi:MAG: hypothetical protein J6A59_05360 [Lachnospiraceae bacterium]|nr:hypothetical protein [Lachnospiraceae bacterium]
MKTYYHATDYSNLASILDTGLKASKIDGLVYLAKTEEDALKFVVLRGYTKIVTFKIKIYKRDEDKVIETFDHNPNFFKCRSFGYVGDISPDKIVPSKRYDLSGV